MWISLKLMQTLDQLATPSLMLSFITSKFTVHVNPLSVVMIIATESITGCACSYTLYGKCSHAELFNACSLP